jgi:hypothetical protein
MKIKIIMCLLTLSTVTSLPTVSAVELDTDKFPIIDNSNSAEINQNYQDTHPGKLVLHDLFVVSDFLDEFRIPSIALTQNGTLIAAVEKREANGDKASNDIVVRTSSDNGIIWSNEVVVASDQISFNDPNMVVANNGHVYLFFNAFESDKGSVSGNPTNMHIGGVYYVRSEDNGATWTAPDLITDTHPEMPSGYSVSPGKSIVLKNGSDQGKIVLPIRVNHTAEGVTGLTADVDNRAGTMTLNILADNSLSYVFGASNPSAEVNEFQLVEMGSNDKLYYLSRDTDGLSWGETSRTLYSTSYDNGASWNDGSSFGFFTTRTQSGLMRSDHNNETRYYYSTPTGEYAYSKGRHQGYIFESAPQGEGVSWKNSRKTLITDYYFGNSTLVDMGDRVGLIYEFSDDKSGLNIGKVQRIRFLSLTKEFLRTGDNAWEVE